MQPPRKEALNNIQRLIKELIAACACEKEWTPTEISTGLCMALGSYLKLCDTMKAVPISLESHWTYGKEVVEMMFKNEEELDAMLKDRDFQKWVN